VAVGVGGQPLDDLAVQLVDLGADGAQGGDQAAGDRGAGLTFGATEPVGGVDQALVELGGGGPAAVADPAQEPAQAGLGQPGGSLGGRDLNGGLEDLLHLPPALGCDLVFHSF